MKFQTLNELLLHTCQQVEFIDNFRKTEYKDVLLSMYLAVDKEFKSNLELLKLSSNNKLEKKQIKFLLRKTKRFRKKSWRDKIKQLSIDFKSNSVDMFNFDMQNLNLTAMQENLSLNIGGETESADTSNSAETGTLRADK